MSLHIKYFFITTDTSIYSKGHPEMVITISNERVNTQHCQKELLTKQGA